jgi:hypothetical protein
VHVLGGNERGVSCMPSRVRCKEVRLSRWAGRVVPGHCIRGRFIPPIWCQRGRSRDANVLVTGKKVFLSARRV